MSMNTILATTNEWMFPFSGFLLNATILPENHPVIEELSKKLTSLTDMIKENDSLKPASNDLNCIKSYMSMVNEKYSIFHSSIF
jgi:hypothetical protein